MAVAETSRSCGKSSASGASRSTRAKRTHRHCRSLPAPAASDAGIYKENALLAKVAPWLEAIEFIVNQTSTSNAGSQLTAGRNVQITATGTDASNPNSGNLNVIGSGVTAGNNVALKASKDINVVSAQDTEAHQTDHSDWTVGAGVGVAASSSGGTSMGVTGNIGVGVATQKSQASTQLNSHITAGNKLSVESGRDTNIAGGVLSADSVNVDVGRNLNIASQQDTASASAKSASASVSATVGYGVSVSASLAYAKSQNDFASVDEQSGIRAGDGGFNINVKGNTDLKGAVITSTQAAVDAGKNSLRTATLTQSDIANHSTADGIGLSGGVSYNTGGSDKDPSKSGTGAKEVGGVKLQDQGNAGLKTAPTSLGAASESDSSTTRSAISGATLTIGTQTTRTDKGEAATDSSGKAINTAATTGTDTAAKLAKPSSLEDIQAQVQITQSFGSQASKAVGDYADSKLKESKQLQAQANQTSNPEQKAALQKQADDLNSTWGEGGAGRVALHTVVGGLTGNTAGAVGAAAASSAAPALNDLQTKISQGLKDAGLSDSVADTAGKIISGTTAVGIGAVAGGGAVGAAAAGNEDFNNRQLHATEVQRIKALANGDAQKEARLTAAACALVHCADGVPKDDPNYTYLKAMQDAGSSLADEQTVLLQQQSRPGDPTRTFGPLFRYYWQDEYITDPASQSKVGTRLAGAAQVTAGVIGAAGNGAMCTSGVGCVAGAVTGTVSLDYAQAGVRQAATGNSTQPAGEQVLESLGLSPQAAAYTYAALGMTPAAVDAVVANKAINAQAAANAWAKGTYTGQSAVTYEGRVYRFSDPQFADKTWGIYPGNVNNNFRYSEPGVGSIYAGTAVQTSAAEVRSYPQGIFQPKTLVAGDVRLDGVLDLTDPAALKALGVTRADITQTNHGVNGAYTQTQRIAEWAREQGYNGILAPSAQSRTGTNLITFDNTKVTNVKTSPLPISVTPAAWK